MTALQCCTEHWAFSAGTEPRSISKQKNYNHICLRKVSLVVI